MLKVLLVLSNYFHDLGVALLAANLFVAYFYQRHARGTAASSLQGKFLPYMRRITYYTLAWILVGGAIRAYYFMDYEWNPAAGRGQVPALIVKHLLLVTIVAYGLVIQRRLFKGAAGGGSGVDS